MFENLNYAVGYLLPIITSIRTGSSISAMLSLGLSLEVERLTTVRNYFIMLLEIYIGQKCGDVRWIKYETGRAIRWKVSVRPLGRSGEWFVVDRQLKVVAPSVSIKARPLLAREGKHRTY